MATVINGNIQSIAICSRCGQTIKNVITISGKPYGLDCGATILGLKEFPKWFNGGDWDKQKKIYDLKVLDIEKEYEAAKERVIEFWDDVIILNKMFINANEWLQSFIISISVQLGLNCIGSICKNKTAEEYLNNTDHLLMSWYPKSNARHISSLSEKQLNILYKNGLK